MSKFARVGAAAALSLIAGSALPLTASAQSASPAFSSGQKPGEVMSSRLAGTRVFNSKGEVIGQINDIVLDANGQAQTVVIGLGGFVGIGAKLVAVPFSAVKIGPVVESARVILLDVTKEQLEKAPLYKAEDPGRADRAKQKAAEWVKIAKDKAVALGNQAGTAIQGVRDKVQTPAPAPKQ